MGSHTMSPRPPYVEISYRTGCEQLGPLHLFRPSTSTSPLDVGAVEPLHLYILYSYTAIHPLHSTSTLQSPSVPYLGSEGSCGAPECCRRLSSGMWATGIVPDPHAAPPGRPASGCWSRAPDLVSVSERPCRQPSLRFRNEVRCNTWYLQLYSFGCAACSFSQVDFCAPVCARQLV